MCTDSFLTRLAILIFALVTPSQSESILSNCVLPSNSPQFATLCRLPDLPLLGVTANMICDADCRCTHGATVRGGRCGIPKGRTEPFCICDYGRTSPREPLLNIPCPGERELLEQLGYLPVLGGLVNGLVSPLVNNLCAADCRCSHGYTDADAEGILSANNGDVNNESIYCICGNARTLPVRSPKQ